MSQIRLLGPTVASEIERNRSVLIREAGQLRLEVPEAISPTVEEDDWLARAVILVIKIGSVALDDRHNVEYTSH